MTLDPEVRDLLTAIRDLDERTRDAGERERSLALAFLNGVTRSMLEHGVTPAHAAATLRAWSPQWERVAEATEAGGS